MLIFSSVNLFACWFFSSWNLYIDSSLRETHIARGTCCVTIFVREAQFILIFFFVKLVECWFILSWNLICHDIFLRETYCMSVFLHEIWCMLIFVRETCCMWSVSSRNLMYLDLFLWETYYFYIPSSRNLLHADFSVSMLALSYWKMTHNDFCSWNLSQVDFSLRATC